MTIPADIFTIGEDALYHSVRHVLEARRILEPQVAILAGRRADDGDFARTQAAIDRVRVHAIQ